MKRVRWPAALLAAALGWAWGLYGLAGARRMETALRQSGQTFQTLKGEIERLRAEQEQAVEENERLRADSISSVALQARLQEECDGLKSRLDRAQADLEMKEAEWKKFKTDWAKLQEQRRKEQAAKEEKLKQEVQELGRQVSELTQTLQKDRSSLYYNLGVAYTKAKLYDDAIGAYRNSLKVNADSPETHYNLGLLYRDIRLDPAKASAHLNRYLALKPDAEDKKEVESWLAQME